MQILNVEIPPSIYHRIEKTYAIEKFQLLMKSSSFEKAIVVSIRLNVIQATTIQIL